MPRRTRGVLVVDDDPTARNVIVHVLRADPTFRVRGVAHDGLEAVRLTGESCPDLIVLDQDMPGPTGLQVLPRLREQCPDARIVLWSREEHVAPLVTAAGGDGFVSKADSLDRLLDWLRAA